MSFCNQIICLFISLCVFVFVPYIPVYKPQLFVSKNGTQSRHAAYHKHTVSWRLTRRVSWRLTRRYLASMQPRGSEAWLPES